MRVSVDWRWSGGEALGGNRCAQPPAGTPPAGSAQAETAPEIDRRCRGQLAGSGRWPLSRTEEIAAAHRYLRVE